MDICARKNVEYDLIRRYSCLDSSLPHPLVPLLGHSYALAVSVLEPCGPTYYLPPREGTEQDLLWIGYVRSYRHGDTDALSPFCGAASCFANQRRRLQDRDDKQPHVHQHTGHVTQLFGRLTSQQPASVPQGSICSDSGTCCHTGIKVTDQTCYSTQSWYTEIGPTSRYPDPMTQQCGRAVKLPLSAALGIDSNVSQCRYCTSI